MLSIRPLAYVSLKSSPIISSLFRRHGRSSTRLAQLLPDVVDSASNRRILNGFRAFSDLSLQKCVPCNRKDLKPMTEQNANVLKPKVPEWELLIDGGVMKLCRKWKVKNFLQGLEFFKVVGDLAEAEGHHPDLHLVGWNNVTVEIWTHACGGLTENDFILAAKINNLPLESYLRRK
uniref:pterin-4-alpha-carbinolamine dehydratase 2, mitochondrial n=1 Tax=Erigeron canadensis TaxID=72917 RepID=UPI001CB921AF|nr:pterin-4-alpha-carbinolamine dehydratase 2, mitochondrial [Erigeron canadensis]